MTGLNRLRSFREIACKRFVPDRVGPVTCRSRWQLIHRSGASRYGQVRPILDLRMRPTNGTCAAYDAARLNRNCGRGRCCLHQYRFLLRLHPAQDRAGEGYHSTVLAQITDFGMRFSVPYSSCRYSLSILYCESTSFFTASSTPSNFG